MENHLCRPLERWEGVHSARVIIKRRVQGRTVIEHRAAFDDLVLPETERLLHQVRICDLVRRGRHSVAVPLCVADNR